MEELSYISKDMPRGCLWTRSHTAPVQFQVKLTRLQSDLEQMLSVRNSFEVLNFPVKEPEKLWNKIKKWTRKEPEQNV